MPVERQSSRLCWAKRFAWSTYPISAAGPAAPLSAHQPEVIFGQLQDLCDRARDGGAEERSLAVDEQHCLAADRQVETDGPVAHVLLAHRGLAQHRLVAALFSALVPRLPTPAGEPRSRQQLAQP